MEFQPNARLAFNQHLRLGAAGHARPARTRLETRAPAGGTSSKVNFVRGGALQSHVRTIGAVPAHGVLHSKLERARPQRHHGQGTSAFLQGADETLHDRNAASLADGAATLADGVAAAPLFQTLTTELLPWSVTRCRGAVPPRATTSPRNRVICFEVGCRKKSLKPRTRRE